MEHLGTIPLESDRLLLRRFTPADAESMFSNWASDERVTKYLSWPPHSSIDITKSILNEWISNYSKKDFYQWAITLKTDVNNPIGAISIVESNDTLSMVHFGYCIGFDYWNKGIVSEAVNLIMKFFFEQVGVSKIESKHDPNNPASGKVMLKNNMIYEGTLRHSGTSNVGICDFSYYSILKNEYFNL
ncbi:MAG: GNAT family N-acetyltransferase [Clostridium sp.]